MHVLELAFVRFACRAAIGEAAGANHDTPTAALDWAAVAAIAARHRATGFVHEALRHLPPGAAPEPVQRHLDARMFGIAAGNLAVISETQTSLDVLGAAGVGALIAPSAGFTLYTSGIRACELRQARLVIHAGDAEGARTVLQASGYRPGPVLSDGAMGFVASAYGRAPVVLDTDLAPSFSHTLSVPAAFAQAVDVPVADHLVRTLATDVRLIALCARAAARGWARLDDVTAIAALGRTVSDWPSILAQAERAGLRRVVLVSVLIARRVLDLECGPPADVARDPVARRIATAVGRTLVDAAEPTPLEAALLQTAVQSGLVRQSRYAAGRVRSIVARIGKETIAPGSAAAAFGRARATARRVTRAQAKSPVKLILRQHQSPGDLVMLTAAVRELHTSHPGRFLTDVRTPCPDLWLHNPYITPLDERDPDVRIIDCEYPLIHQSNQAPVHFVQGFVSFLNDRLDVQMGPTAPKGDIWLSDAERCRPSPAAELAGHEAPYWIVAAGGKFDFTIKWWTIARYQAVVDHFRGRLTFVQIGEAGHHHPPLDGVIDLRGRTSLRDLIRLVYRADGVIGPVSLLMHLAAAVDTPPGRPPARPCVVIAGGREPVQWEAYPGHQFLHTIGALPCCATGGCWRSRTVPLGDGDPKDEPGQLCVDVVEGLPHCMDLIRADDVIRSVERYLAAETAPAPPAPAARPRPARRPRERIIEHANAPVGLVIGTFAAVPYIHLALESRRLHYPDVPVLVHDDGSPKTEVLRALCREYGVDFSTNGRRLAPTVGDLSSYVRGLDWATERQVDLLVKMSRRFIVLDDWAPALQRLAYETQYATYSQRCRHFDFGFRTECLALHVETWRQPRALPVLRELVERNAPTFVEGFLHQVARDLHQHNCRANQEYEARAPRSPDTDAYGVWEVMADRRTTKQPRVLWHDADQPDDYWRAAFAYGLPYTVEDFADPNQGYGSTP